MPFELRACPYEAPEVVRMVAEVQDEYVVRYGGPDAAAVDPDEFRPPLGLFLVGALDGEPVAIGGWRRMGGPDGSTAEIKRMYVSIPVRRRGLARLLLAELEASAAAAGITHLVLNTGTEQPEAVALYEASGYTAVPDFGHYAGAPKALFYGKDVVPRSVRPSPGTTNGPPSRERERAEVREAD